MPATWQAQHLNAPPDDDDEVAFGQGRDPEAPSNQQEPALHREISATPTMLESDQIQQQNYVRLYILEATPHLSTAPFVMDGAKHLTAILNFYLAGTLVVVTVSTKEH
ncbi:hypothetical protein H257_14290 [Aphanomyces astaci]|uniref:Uncharacterized protein n=1 Tax=Aphanomyces astaci TaxID=112090 RepID=W4FRL0_APHAT|nr:hypothetical protein H257_14290 [Aphanomyces astaci]ETV70130.1 hypothetical protein H257_14290 [Aphanomyces astaci]|eukprot:XP_009840361.1 hypothetical protein H257_14290 [Aphanomyces astaci]